MDAEFNSNTTQILHKVVNHVDCRVIIREVINLPSNKQGKLQNITHKLLRITLLCRDAHTHTHVYKKV